MILQQKIGTYDYILAIAETEEKDSKNHLTVTMTIKLYPLNVPNH